MDACNGLQSRAPLRVIVADDDALVRRVLRDVLQRAGIVVIAEAGGGREAVELTLYYKPDVVLMDLLMPGTDGIAATREILAGQPDAKVVMISSSEDEELGLLSLRMGACGFLSKTVNIESIPRANAAATPATGAPFTDDDLEGEVNVKVRGYLRCARAVAPLMVESGWGRIVNIAGLAARQTGNLVGTVRNVAVAALTKNLADELGPRGVNVNVVHPGMTRTERTPEAMAAMAQSRGVTVEELERALQGAVSLGRLVTAEEVAAVVTFLASPKSVAINGDPVVAGGGARGSIHY